MNASLVSELRFCDACGSKQKTKNKTCKQCGSGAGEAANTNPVSASAPAKVGKTTALEKADAKAAQKNKE